jgi:DNA-binding XRE family transcriptional regulator
MPQSPIGNYLRMHRKHCGLSLHELGLILGYRSRDQVIRHERSDTPPPLTKALAYEVVFRVPLSALFPGIHTTVAKEIEDKLASLEANLQQRSAKEPGANLVAQKLIWLAKRTDVL